MYIEMSEKQAIIQHLLAAKTNSYRAEFVLLMKGYDQEAGQVKALGKDLSRKIDSLIAGAMANWIANSKEIIGCVGLINQGVEEAIAGINNGLTVVSNVVKLVGLIDELLGVFDRIRRA